MDQDRRKKEMDLQNSVKALVNGRGENNENRNESFGCWELSRQTWRLDRRKRDEVWLETTGTWRDRVDDDHRQTILDSH